jgi:N-acetylneuraminic acid mutarotase
MHTLTRRRRILRRNGCVISLLSIMSLTACGGDGGSATAEHALGASINGLTASGLVLAVDGTNVAVPANATRIQLSSSIPAGTAYSVAVQTQPTSLRCIVSNGSGTMGAANVTDIVISCQPEAYAIGGTVAGLTAGGLVLANGSSTLSVPSGATSFTMPNGAASGSTYDITVQTQPAGLQCVVGAGFGTIASAAVTSIVVTCTPRAAWVWMGGSSTPLAAGVYGTEGVAAAGNVPGARILSTSWTGPSSLFWLFGGRSTDNALDLNDLWSYSPATREWTWVGGSNTAGAAGVFGTRGVAASSNVPGSRDAATSWVDPGGNLWLFGGEQFAGASGSKFFNDLWKYNTATGEWTWFSGAESADAAGVYGTKGVAAAGDVPGARAGAASWVDSAGNLWLFGGLGHDGTGATGDLADLWEFDVAAGQWIWICGPSTVNGAGTYGAEGVAAATNLPGAREFPVSWVDATGDLWLFGGQGYDSSGSSGQLGDLWRYDHNSGQWVWEGGSASIDSPGVYGTQGVSASANVPGARDRANGWTDANGNLWLFGGYGFDSAGSGDNLDDLWMYDMASRQWTWESGSNTGGTMGVYGTEGVPSAANVPGGRTGSASWIDSTGRLWLFGGLGCTAGSGYCIDQYYLNDLWSY